MSSGLKMFLWFLAGTASGAAGLAYLNRNKMDFSYMKPVCENLIAKGMEMSDKTVAKFSELKENLEDMTMAARDRVDADRMAQADGCQGNRTEKTGESC